MAPYLQNVKSPSHVSAGKGHKCFHPVLTQVHSERNEAGGSKRPSESTSIHQECDQGFEIMKKKGKDTVNSTLSVGDLESALVFRAVGFTLAVTTHPESGKTLTEDQALPH